LAVLIKNKMKVKGTYRVPKKPKKKKWKNQSGKQRDHLT
jgi:hypothetical protein